VSGLTVDDHKQEHLCVELGLEPSLDLVAVSGSGSEVVRQTFGLSGGLDVLDIVKGGFGLCVDYGGHAVRFALSGRGEVCGVCYEFSGRNLQTLISLWGPLEEDPRSEVENWGIQVAPPSTSLGDGHAAGRRMQGQ
jgi:hypothetical protein